MDINNAHNSRSLGYLTGFLDDNKFLFDLLDLASSKEIKYPQDLLRHSFYLKHSQFSRHIRRVSLDEIRQHLDSIPK